MSNSSPPAATSVTCPDGSWFKFDYDVVEVDADHILANTGAVANTNSGSSSSNSNNNANSNSNSNSNSNANTGKSISNRKKVVTSSCYHMGGVQKDGTVSEATVKREDETSRFTWIDCQEKYSKRENIEGLQFTATPT
jgi:hypothetical protein